MAQNSLFQMYFVTTSNKVRQKNFSLHKIEDQNKLFRQKSSILPNQMTEKYLVEVDIENPYFYG